MKSSFISTVSWTTSAMSSMSRLQSDIAKTTEEISSGRLSDVGLTLGLETGRSVSLYATQASISAQTQSNEFASNIISGSQTVLSELIDSATDTLSNLASAASSSADIDSLVTESESAFASLFDMINYSDGQRYLFGGTNSSVQPLNDYDNEDSAVSDPKEAVESAFYTAFGMYPDDENVSSISADDMSEFLDGDFADLFDDANWSSIWSNASDTALTSQISSSGTRLSISTTANTDAVRNLTMALTMVTQLGTASLSADTSSVLIEKATALAGAAVTQFTSDSAALGVAQSRIDSANEVLDSASSLVETQISSLEGVDVAEAKTQLDTMTTQLEMSYSTTSTLLQLSLLDYA